MKIELECTSLDALAATLADRFADHADYAVEELVDVGFPAAADRWREMGKLARRDREIFTNTLAIVLEALQHDQKTLSPCPSCGGQRDRDPRGAVYCTECRAR